MEAAVEYTWKADLRVIDVDGLGSVVKQLDWTCVATLIDTSCFAIGITNLLDPDPFNAFIDIADIDGSVIRSWVPNFELIEEELADRVTIMHYLPDPSYVRVPAEG